MSQTYKYSFLVTLGLIFLLPIFFIPGGALELSIAKSAFIVFSMVAVMLVFIYESWRAGTMSITWHSFVLLVAMLPLIYLFSALLTNPTSLSILGYNFEIGTFGYILICSLLAILFSIIYLNTSRILQSLLVFFASISLVALFSGIKILYGSFSKTGGDILVFGNFFGNVGNPIGNWTDLAISFGLLAIFAALVIGMIPMKRSARFLVYGAFTLGTILLAIINYSIAFFLTFGASIILILYFWKMEKHFLHTTPNHSQTSQNFFLKPIFLPILLGLISLLFIFNPNISSTQGTLSGVVASKFKVSNVDVRPSLSATLNVSRAVLSQERFFGSGPNTFERDWLIYKPVAVNVTPFWAVSFPFGVGFIITQVASIGIVGALLWLVFFITLIFLGIKALTHIPESRTDRFAIISTLIITLFLWTAGFLYTPSVVVLTFTFIFSGLFISACRESGIIYVKNFNIKEFSQTRFVSAFVFVLVVIGTMYLGWAGFDKTVAAYHFKKAVDLSNINGIPFIDIENHINEALSYAPADIHYVALSRINFAKAQVAANATTGTAEVNKEAFEEAVRRSIDASKNAVSANPAGFQNWVSLGLIYSALVPPPLSIDGAYENATFAFSEASKRNPLNPEIPLFLAQLELNHGNMESAISFVRNSIALKEDYADAYLTLAQLEVRSGNIIGAIESAEKLALLVPNNVGLHFELGLLKYSNRDYAGAMKVFEQAITLVPDYANAKYYLGLTLVRLGKIDEALAQFESLVITNPNNEELDMIIKELKAGKTSFLDKLSR